MINAEFIFGMLAGALVAACFAFLEHRRQLRQIMEANLEREDTSNILRQTKQLIEICTKYMIDSERLSSRVAALEATQVVLTDTIKMKEDRILHLEKRGERENG